MPTHSTLNLQQFAADIDKIKTAWDFESMVGRKLPIQFLKAMCPLSLKSKGLDTPSLRDFKLYSSESLLKPSPHSACLFYGAAGNGASTMDYALAEYFSAMGDIHTFFIQMNQLRCKEKEQTVANIEQLFQQIAALADNEDYEESLIYISLGNLRPLLSQRKTLKHLARQIELLLQSEVWAEHEIVLQITAICHEPLDCLPNSLRKLLTPVFLDHPTASERADYFFTFSKVINRSVEWELSPQELADETENFTFLMLKHTVELLYLWVKSELMAQYIQEDITDDEATNYFIGQAEKPFIVPTDIIRQVIEQVRHELPKENITQMIMPSAAMMTMQPAPAEKPVQQLTTEEQLNMKKEDLGKQIKNVATLKELREAASNLAPAIRTKTTFSDYDGPNQNNSEQE